MPHRRKQGLVVGLQLVGRLEIVETLAQVPQPARVASELGRQLTVVGAAGASQAGAHVGRQGRELPVDLRELVAVLVLGALTAPGERQSDEQGAQKPGHASPD